MKYRDMIREKFRKVREEMENTPKYLSGKNGFKYLDLDLFGDIKVDVFKPKIDNYYTTLSYIKDMKWK